MGSIFFKKSVRALLILFIFIACVLLFKYVFIYVYPFIIVLILASLLHPLVSFIQYKWKLSRTFATFFIMCGFFSVGLIGSYLFLTKITKETLSLLNHFPEHIQVIKKISLQWINTLYRDSVNFLPIIKHKQIEDIVDNWTEKLTEYSIQLLSQIVFTTSEIINSITYIGVVSIFIVMAVFIITKDYALFIQQCNNIIPERMLNLLRTLWKHMKQAVIGLIKAQFLLTFLSTILIAMGLLLFQTNHFLLLICVIFFIDFIPYIGIGIIFIPWILYQFFTNNFTSSLELSVLYVLVIIFRQIIEPRLIANKIGLHPIIALSALFLGIQLFGVIGLFITPLSLIIISACNRAGIFQLLWNFIQDV